MQTQQINFENITNYLFPITQLRRDPNSLIRKVAQVGSVLVTKDGIPILKVSHATSQTPEMTIEEKLAKIKTLVGGFHLGRGMTPKQINNLLDKRYEEMLS